MGVKRRDSGYKTWLWLQGVTQRVSQRVSQFLLNHHLNREWTLMLKLDLFVRFQNEQAAIAALWRGRDSNMHSHVDSYENIDAGQQRRST